MADDIVSAFGKAAVAFAHSRAAALVRDCFVDAGSFLASLVDGTDGTTQAEFERLQEDVEALGPLASDLVDALKPDLEAAAAAVGAMADELDKDPFGAGEALRALTALAQLLMAYDRAIGTCAEKLAQQEPPGPGRAARAARIRADIQALQMPIRRALRDVGTAGGTPAAEAFDRLVRFTVGVDRATEQLARLASWDLEKQRVAIPLVQVGTLTHGALSLDGGTLEAYFQYRETPSLGVTVRTRMRAGLRSDKLLQKIMPGQGATADTETVAIRLDTVSGLTLGDGKSQRIVVPARFGGRGVELREFALERPAAQNSGRRGRIDVVATVAGKLGDAFAVVAEGGGSTIRWVDGASFEVLSKIPTGAGLRIRTGIVTGGGFLRYDEAREEYGGVFQLEIAKVGVTAFALIGTRERFSLVVVMGVRFSPKIELGWGFTLNALGGIVAIERALASDELVKGLKNDAVGQMLFPADPVAAAPKILDTLSAIFPVTDGGLVIGPIAELGWGSQAAIVKARLGLVLSLPDPKVVLLGAIEVGLPSVEVPKALRLVDINANLMGEVNDDHFFLKVSILQSKLFQVTLTGDIAIYVQWGGQGAFALSLGGFFPGYEAPKVLGPMNRLALQFAPPLDMLTLSAQAYFAITANSVQFGGRIDLRAKIGPAKAEAWIQLDALFQWAPHLHFEVRLDVGIRVSVFGVTVSGVHFTGLLRGDRPFHLEGYAKVETLFFDFDVPIGPVEWGDPAPAPLPTVAIASVVAQALRAPEAWRPLLPAGAGGIVGLHPDTPGDLVHPLGQLEVRQLHVPLEFDVDRVGSAAVDSRRVNLADPVLGAAAAGAVWPVRDRFSPGHFLDLSDEQVIALPEFEELQAGLGMAAADGPTFADAVHAGYGWNTVYPGEAFPTDANRWHLALGASKVLASSAVARSLRERGNPYAPLPPTAAADPLLPRGSVVVTRRDTLEAAGLASGPVGGSEAARIVRDLGSAAQVFTTVSRGFLS